MDKFVFLFVVAVCGTSSVNAEGQSRIVNGSVASENQFRYMISLQQLSQIQNNTRGHRCGGALVSLQHAVTAASCTLNNLMGVYSPINPAEYRVFAGSVVLTNDSSADRIRSIANFTVHPEYETGSPSVNDIAIITLVTPFLSDTVTPVQLSFGDPYFTDINACTVAGWGAQNTSATASTHLMQLQKTVFNHNTCRLMFMDQLPILPTMICAWTGRSTFSGCTGDLGNPLVCNDTLTGVFVRGNDCSASANPEVYTRISRYAEWIDQITFTHSGASTLQTGISILAMFAVVQIITANVLS